MQDETSHCWCGNDRLVDFDADYFRCPACETLVLRRMPGDDVTAVGADEAGLYGKEYWFDHQENDVGFPNITQRSRADLPERCVHWLRAVLKYKLPPARTLELGAAHGGFVATLRLAGFDSTGLELSPWIADYARKTFGVPMLQGPVEKQGLAPGSLDLLAAMDVIEHLPDPIGTLRACVNLLKPDGVLMLQTPQYVEGRTIDQLRAEGATFVQHLRPQEHLHLFSRSSAAELMRRVGVPHVTFEPAMFAQYDQFFVASRQPPVVNDEEAVRRALEATPDGRLAGAILDLADERDYYRAECEARMHVIEVLDTEVKRLQALQATARPGSPGGAS
jgi:2-polyprenyl-3-methyl-5-hydroxy-6-metoxy-1,4-benzoquinol methylase